MLRLGLEIGIGLLLLFFTINNFVNYRFQRKGHKLYCDRFYSLYYPMSRAIEKTAIKHGYKYFNNIVYYNGARRNHYFEFSLDKNHKSKLRYYYNDGGRYEIKSQIKPNYDNEKLLEFIKKLNSIYL